ncbi:MAG: inositol monophosphatase family protein [Aggregatilineales bacterium]
MTLNLQETLDEARHIAYSAGGILRAYYEGSVSLTTKSSSVDIVTEADKDAEIYITGRLLNAFPEMHIVGEEGGGSGADIATAEYRWYVDPVDGTTNFANKLPVFAISLALTDAKMNPLVGVVYNPITNEMFTAYKGGGAMLNGRTLTVSDATTLNQCVLASGFPYDKATNPNNNLDHWGAFLVRTRGMRRWGAAALDLCYVAAGRFDGYWEGYLNPWDLLGGVLLIQEAGGIVSDYTGETDPETIYSRGYIVAANPTIHPLMLDVLNKR